MICSTRTLRAAGFVSFFASLSMAIAACGDTQRSSVPTSRPVIATSNQASNTNQSSERTSLIFEDNPDVITVNDIALALALYYLPEDVGNAVIADAASNLLDTAEIINPNGVDPTLRRSSTDFTKSGDRLTLNDIAILLAAFRSPLNSRSEKALANRTNRLLGNLGTVAASDVDPFGIPVPPVILDGDPGSSLADALEIEGFLDESFPAVQALNVVDVGEEDYYRFSLDGASQLQVILSDQVADADIQIVEDVNENQVFDDGETVFFLGEISRFSFEDRESLKIKLDPGTYYIRVFNAASEGTRYTLNLSARPANNPSPQEPGDDFGSALDLGILGTRQLYDGYVGSTDELDLYKFELSSTSEFSASLEEQLLDADFEIIRDANGNGQFDRDDGEVVAFVGEPFSSSFEPNEALTTTLDNGTYFVRVFRGSRNETGTSYTLSLSAEPAESESKTDPGNLLTSAFDAGLLGDTRRFRSYVGRSDSFDYYNFKLDRTSELDVNLSSQIGDADLQLIRDVNGNGTVEEEDFVFFLGEQFSSSFETPETLKIILDEGDYFARVFGGSRNETGTGYELTLGAAPAPGGPPADPGETVADAFDLGSLTSTETIPGYTGVSDVDDYYAFDLDRITRLGVSLTRQLRDADLQIGRDVNSNGLFDEGEAVFFLGESFSSSFEPEESVNIALDSGSYFIRVFNGARNDTGTSYRLSLAPSAVDAAPDRDPGSDYADAVDLGQVDSLSQTQVGYVGVTDPLDVYRFELTRDAVFRLDLSALLLDANVEIARDIDLNGRFNDGEVLVSSEESGDTSETIESSLDAGTYFIRILPESRVDSGTSYTLTFSTQGL